MIISRPILKGEYNSYLDKNTNSLVLIAIDNSFSNNHYNSIYLNKTLNKIKNIYNPNTVFQIYKISNNQIIYNGVAKDLNTNSIQINKNYISTNIFNFLNGLIAYYGLVFSIF